MIRNFCLIIFLAVLLLFNGVPQAATLFQETGISSSPGPVSPGAKAVGMGGAFIAVADDATAASWNPAGLIRLERPGISVSGAYFKNTDDFTSDHHPEIENKGAFDSTNINYFSAVYPLQFLKKDIVVSINYQRLYEFGRGFSHNFDYSDLDADLIQDKDFSREGYLGAIGLASAVRITPELSFGAALNIWTDKLPWDNGWSEKYSEHSTGTLAGTPVTLHKTISDSYSRFQGINANLGLLWNANEYLTVGAVIKTPFKASLYHEFNSLTTTVKGPPVNTTVITPQHITENIDLDMPVSYGLGLALRLSDRTSFALDVYRTEWDKYMLTNSEGSKVSPIDGRSSGDSTVRPTTQVRIGGEHLFIREETVVPVRAGLFYDPEPSHGSPEDLYGISIGSGIGYKRMIFDAAYQLKWGHDVGTDDLISTSKADIIRHLVLASVIVHF